MIATDWAGMSSYDALTVAGALSNVSDFVYLAERLQQGVVVPC